MAKLAKAIFPLHLSIAIVTLLMFGSYCDGVLCVMIQAFDSNGKNLGFAPNMTENGVNWLPSYGGYYHPSASYYLVGTGPEVVEFWQPFDCWNGGGLMMGLQIDVAAQMVQEEFQDPTGGDTLQVKLVCADWDGVVGDPICTGDLPCPSLVLIGTTQLHARIEEGSVLSLNHLMSKWTERFGIVLSDDFIKYYFYDFNVNGDWFAVPLVSDTRMLVFNTTTFDRLGLKYPPPWDHWGEHEWNWEKFTDYAINIKNGTGKDGWTMKMCWDEELKIALMIGNNYRAHLYRVNANGILECDLGENFVTAMENTMAKMFKSGAVGPISGWVPIDTDDFREWEAISSFDDPLESYPSSFHDGAPVFCCKCFERGSFLNGMAIEPPGVLGSHKDNPSILEAFIPGRFSFLGGSGLFIPAQATTRMQELGWELLTHFIMRISDFGEVVRSPPPLESFWSQAPWNQPKWLVIVEQLKASVPAQYPLQSFPEFGAIEWFKPFRMMWLEMKYKEVSTDLAVTRLCSVIDDIFTPICTEEEHTHHTCQICTYSDYGIDLSECHKNQKHIASFFKIPVDNRTECVGGFKPPDELEVVCRIVNASSTSGILSLALSAFGLSFCLLCGIITFVKRKHKVMNLSQPMFCALYCCGAAATNIYAQISVGAQTTFSCNAKIIVLVMSSSLMINALVLKLHRIYKLFLNKRLKKLKLTNCVLLQRLILLLLADVCIIFVCGYIAPIHSGTVIQDISLGLSVEETLSIPHQVCMIDKTFTTIVWVWKAAFIFIGCYLSWETRNIRQEYSESKYIFIAMSNLAFAGIMSGLLEFGVDIPIDRRLMVETIVIMWCSTASVVFLMFPKFYFFFHSMPEVRRNASIAAQQRMYPPCNFLIQPSDMQMAQYWHSSPLLQQPKIKLSKTCSTMDTSGYSRTNGRCKSSLNIQPATFRNSEISSSSDYKTSINIGKIPVGSDNFDLIEAPRKEKKSEYLNLCNEGYVIKEVSDESKRTDSK